MNIPHFVQEQHKADENPNTKCNFKILSKCREKKQSLLLLALP